MGALTAKEEAPVGGSGVAVHLVGYATGLRRVGLWLQAGSLKGVARAGRWVPNPLTVVADVFMFKCRSGCERGDRAIVGAQGKSQPCCFAGSLCAI